MEDERKQDQKLRALVYQPGQKEPHEIYFSSDEHEMLRETKEILGGYYDVVTLGILEKNPNSDDVEEGYEEFRTKNHIDLIALVNEECLINGMRRNRIMFTQSGHIYDGRGPIILMCLDCTYSDSRYSGLRPCFDQNAKNCMKLYDELPDLVKERIDYELPQKKMPFAMDVDNLLEYFERCRKKEEEKGWYSSDRKVCVCYNDEAGNACMDRIFQFGNHNVMVGGKDLYWFDVETDNIVKGRVFRSIQMDEDDSIEYFVEEHLIEALGRFYGFCLAD